MSKNESIKSELDLLKGLIYLLTFCGVWIFANTYKNAEILAKRKIAAILINTDQ